MLGSLALPLLAYASAAFASPVSRGLLHARQHQPGPWCDGLGAGVFDIAPQITLAALNTTLPNANNTGAPLVMGQAGAVDGASFAILSTFASFPFNEFPTLSLLNGTLIPNLPGGILANASDSSVAAGTAPSWIITGLDLPTPAQIYCGVADTDPAGGGTGFPLLALNGDTDHFSLCSAGDFHAAQTNIIWRASSVNDGSYNFTSCYPVHIQIIELE
ncbi:hypothetical protein CERSUDRAFT_115735 [Gelatoporia subvermispora B]|uniref:Uncharacterized protein n=1 Tax=Ceriporiopsis subvermispora (strain B) TaxID=914234 RepID=M2RBJ5_CERS8|nr:hypothetical protein CERSUDRAFT_115735 [Gelatoporia subvermispora B]